MIGRATTRTETEDIGVATDAGPGTPGRLARAMPSKSELRGLVAGSGLIGRFGYLVLTQGVTVALGLAYWAMTTRKVNTHAVGVSAAAVSAAAFISAIGIVGIGSLLIVEVQRVPERSRRAVVSTGCAVAALVAMVLALGTWALSPFLGASLSEMGRHPAEALLFVAGATVSTVANVLDASAIGLRKGPAQLARNGAASAFRLALVFGIVALGFRTTTGLLFAWVVGVSLSLLLTPWLLGLHKLAHGPTSLHMRWDIIVGYRQAAFRHHALNLAITSVSFFLPVLAALFLIPQDYAYFSIAQLVSSTVLLLPALLAMSLFAEASGDPSSLAIHVRRTLPIGMGCCIAALAIVEPGASTILGVFGPQYAEHGTTILRLLMLAGIPYVIKDHYVAIRRAQDRLTEAARVVTVATGFEAAAAAAGAALFGVEGLCGFWVAATIVEAVFFAPVTWRVIRGHGDQAGTPALDEGDDPEIAPGALIAELSPIAGLGAVAEQGLGVELEAPGHEHNGGNGRKRGKDGHKEPEVAPKPSTPATPAGEGPESGGVGRTALGVGGQEGRRRAVLDQGPTGLSPPGRPTGRPDPGSLDARGQPALGVVQGSGVVVVLLGRPGR